MIEEEIEIPEPKTHSIVTDDSVEGRDCCQLRPNHKGVTVTYKGVTGWLIRYVTTCNHHLLALSTSEARECLKQNAPEEEAL